MRYSPLIVITVVWLLFAPSGVVHGKTTADRESVRRAVLDYVEGFYEGDTAKLVRSVRPEVQKQSPPVNSGR